METSPIHKLEEKLLRRRSIYYRVRRYAFILAAFSLFGIGSLYTDSRPEKYEMIELAAKTFVFLLAIAFYGHIRIQHIESILFYRKKMKNDISTLH